MIKNLVVSALFAGFAAGLIAAMLQLAFVQPVLLEAELYESGQLTHFAVGEGAHDHASHDHGDAPEAAAMTRNALSILFTALLYTGYGMIMVAGMALAARSGHATNARRGLLWGVAGFVAFHLMPAAGLPPELPGSAAVDLNARQIWWFATAIASVVALALISFGHGWAMMALAVVLLLAPHIIGALAPQKFIGVVPPELAAEYAGRTLAVGLAAWAVLGTFAGFFWNRMEKD